MRILKIKIFTDKDLHDKRPLRQMPGRSLFLRDKKQDIIYTRLSVFASLREINNIEEPR